MTKDELTISKYVSIDLGGCFEMVVVWNGQAESAREVVGSGGPIVGGYSLSFGREAVEFVKEMVGERWVENRMTYLRREVFSDIQKKLRRR